MALIKPKDIKVKKPWGSKPSRWFNTSKDEQMATYKVWSNTATKINIEIKDEQEQVVYSSHEHMHKGLNLWKWNYILDQKLALKAEAFKNKEQQKPLNRSLTPIDEAIRLGHDLYIPKGTYSIHISTESDQQSAEFKVE